MEYDSAGKEQTPSCVMEAETDPDQEAALNMDLSLEPNPVVSKSVPYPSVNRSLPTWIQESSQDVYTSSLI